MCGTDGSLAKPFGNKDKVALAQIGMKTSRAENAPPPAPGRDGTALALDVVKLSATSKIHALKELVDRLHAQGAVADSLQFLQCVLEREALQSTVVAEGVALPHARCRAATRLAAAVGVAPQGIEYPSGDEVRRVSVICLLAVPTRAPIPYLEWLSRLAERLGAPAAQRQLAAGADVAVVRRLLAGSERLAPAGRTRAGGGDPDTTRK